MLLKAKDYVTLGNAFFGFLSVIMVMRGELEWASYCIMFAWVCDLGDGMVARLTNQFNKFGAELDNVADLVAYSIAPGYLMYGFFTQHSTMPPIPWWAAVIVGAFPVLAGCIRFARFNVTKLHYDGAWFGFPRPAAAFLYIGYINSSMGHANEITYYLGIVLVIATSLAHFILIPYVNHHREVHHTYLKVAYWFIFSSLFFAGIGHAITGVGLFWDVLTFWFLCYLFLAPYLCFPPEEKRKIKATIEEWKKSE